MFTISNFDYNCTTKCKHVPHGNFITSCLTKRAVDDQSLASCVAKSCRNFAEVLDSLGRSSLHICCSVDRYFVAEWLLNHGSFINFKDRESGSTPLHRAIYYGCIDCAVLLLRYGANPEILDVDQRTSLQYICHMNDFQEYKGVTPLNELLVWGANKNYNLGIINDNVTTLPQSIDYFRKEHISVDTLSISSYHSIFLTKKGVLYAVGHGKGGRCGTGDEKTLPTPKKIKNPLKKPDDKIVQVSCSKNHTLLLSSKNSVFSCGINDQHQLGFKPPPEKQTTFREIQFPEGISNAQKIIARDNYSVLYTKKEIYVWGENCGQFGISNMPDVILPKRIDLLAKSQIDFVECNNVAMAVVSKHIIYLFYNNKVNTIKVPNVEHVKCLQISGGGSSGMKGSAAALRLIILTTTNVLFIWYENSEQFLRCSFTNIHLSQIDKMLCKSNQLFILSQGDVYTGKCSQITFEKVFDDEDSSWFCKGFAKKEVSQNYRIKVELKQIPLIDRAVDIFADDDLFSFAVLQENSRKYFKLPQLPPEEYSFKKLMHDAHEFDEIHDVVFHVDSEVFYCHKFLIYSRSIGLRDIVEQQMDKHVHFSHLENLTGKMFEIILKFIYSNYYFVIEDIDDIIQSLGPLFSGDRFDCGQLFLGFLEMFEMTELAHHLKILFKIADTPPNARKHSFPRLKRTSFPKLYDVIIKCDNDQHLEAHKCVLVTKLEYFSLMFTHSWSERSVINLTTVSIDYLRPLIDFVYTSDADYFKRQNYNEAFLYQMVVLSDQFFVERLKKVCEILILEKISVRKCGEMLEFAMIYNCEILKNGCLEFICQNLSRVLSQKSLEGCDPEVLKAVNKKYRTIFKEVFDYRMITPNSDAVEDEVLESFIEDFEVDLGYRMSEEEQEAVNVRKQDKENKIKDTNTRQHEKQAIMSMRELNLRDERKVSESNDLKKEAEKVDSILQAEAKAWTTINDKKEVKKRIPLKTNEVLNTEPKPSENFRVLEPRKSVDSEPYTSHAAMSLSDFGLHKNQKMSQKERKRLSSTSKAPVFETPPKSVPTSPQVASPWGVVSTNESSPIERRQRKASSDCSFIEILENEKKQKEHFDRMISKSLHLTQIEELAIGELKQFYNVDNVADEVITIQRKPMPKSSMNFAVWQKN